MAGEGEVSGALMRQLDWLRPRKLFEKRRKPFKRQAGASPEPSGWVAGPMRLRGVWLAPLFGAGLFVSDEVSPAAGYLAGTEGGGLPSLRSIAAGQRPRSFAARASCNHSSASLSHASLSSGLIAFSASLRHFSAELRNLSASVSRIAPE
jgi:hypothetical protein